VSEGVELRQDGRRVRLKWHQLRRASADPPHDRANLRLGIDRGASLEVDIVATRDGHFACLHDSELASETNGRGQVHERDRSDVERLRQCGNDGRPLASPPLFLDEVVATLTRAPADWPGRLQLDLKQPLHLLSAALVERFATLVEPLARHLMLGGTEWRAVVRLGRGVPGLRLGFDPLAIHEAAPPQSVAEFEALGAYALAHAPEAAIFYLHIPTVLLGLGLGVDLIAMAKARGAEVDVWRLEPEDEQALARLAQLVEAGVDQITTDSPEALERLWQHPARRSSPE
jgi:glycerophosphoryl diester phosphodiesterase